MMKERIMVKAGEEKNMAVRPRIYNYPSSPLQQQ